jgi:hypothetical protein
MTIKAKPLLGPKARTATVWIAYSPRRYVVGKTKREVMEIIQATDKRGPHVAQRFVLPLNGRTGVTADALGRKLRLVHSTK